MDDLCNRHKLPHGGAALGQSGSSQEVCCHIHSKKTNQRNTIVQQCDENPFFFLQIIKNQEWIYKEIRK